jgi:glucose/arabinose dehydrogenase
MNTPTRLAGVLALAALVSSAGRVAAQPQPVADPIPKKIEKGDITVAVRDFVRVPKTTDSATPRGTSGAYARVQYLLPARDGTGRLFINDTRGVLYVTDAKGTEPKVYLDLRKQDVGFDDSHFPNEAGLAGFAFHPDFAKKGRPGYRKFFTAYSAATDSGKATYLDDDDASHQSVLREWTVEDPAAETFAGTSREVFRIGQFAFNHNIGTIAFNPNAKEGSPDYGNLYVCLGDGGAANDPKGYGQGLAEPHGAIMRIHPFPRMSTAQQYTVPADNPFVGREGVAPAIWAYGFRHPQQFSWDTGGDGKMLIAEFGQGQVEEVNLGVAGGNYGWQLREGTFATAFAVTGDKRPEHVFPRPDKDEAEFLYPVAQYDHDEGRGISGGFVYRGSRVPELQGKYVFSELVRGRLFYVDADTLAQGKQAEIKELRLTFGGQERDLIDVVGYPNPYAPGTKRADLRLGTDDAGELYLLTKGDGRVRTLDAAKWRRARRPPHRSDNHVGRHAASPQPRTSSG